MKRKHFVFLLCLTLLIALCGGCGGQSTPERSGLTIGFSMATLLEDRWLRDRDIFVAKAQQLGITVHIRNANKDSSVQLLQVQELLETGIDVLVIAPNDSIQEKQCVTAAKEKGVPVVLYDRFIHQSDADVFVTFNGEQVGEIMASYLLEKVPEGGYVFVNGSQNDNNSTMIRDGYMKRLQPHINSGAVEVLAESWTEGWVREKAYDFVSGLIPTIGERISAIICANDSLAWGVTDALTEARLDNVEVVGMDADLSACQRIVRRKQGMTVYKPIRTLVEETLIICQELAESGSIEEYLQRNRLDANSHVTITEIVDGSYTTPYVAIDVVMVTADTMEETVISDGFHLKEDIYSQPDPESE